MATPRQIAANRLNAARSTGPKTEAGKARSRANALTHGLAGSGAAVAEAFADVAAARREAWHAEIRPETDEAAWSLDLAVAITTRLDRCDDTHNALVGQSVARARLAWDIDRRLDAATLAEGLPRRPYHVVAGLEATRHGAELLAGAWHRLGASADARGAWSDAERSEALDLLGVPPGPRPAPTPADAPPGDDARDHLTGLARGEIRRLEALLAGSLEELDALRRRHAEAGALVVLSAESRLVQRYEGALWGRFRAAMKAARAPADADAPAPMPAPEIPEMEDAEPEPEPEAEPTAWSEVAERVGEMAARREAIEAMVRSARTPEERAAAEAAIVAEMTAMAARRGETFAGFPGDEDDSEPTPIAPAPLPSPTGNRHARRATAARSRRA